MPLKDYAFIDAGQFTDLDNDGDNIADGLWCQSASSFNESVIAGGGWYIPSGDRVDFNTSDTSLHQKLFTRQFVLLRSGTVNLEGYEGLYQCKIPHTHDNISVLMVGIYGTAKYKNNGMV